MTGDSRPTVLIVDDNAHNLQVLGEIVEASGYDSVLAMTAIQAFDFLATERPDLILLDVMMPDLDGFQVCARLKSDPTLAAVPVVFLTARTAPDDIVQGFEAGAIDYISKPFHAAELRARMRAHLELKQARDRLVTLNAELRRANDLIQRRNAQLREVMTALEHASAVDPLTGLCNRRRMMERLQEEVARVRRSLRPFALILGDMDHFKQINDENGHDGGDAVLQRVAQCLGRSLREVDAVSRWGGEEFLVLLSEVSLEGALAAAERIRTTVASEQVPHGDRSLTATLTLGVALYDPDAPVEETIKRADRALYQGKALGRNCVVGAD